MEIPGATISEETKDGNVLKYLIYEIVISGADRFKAGRASNLDPELSIAKECDSIERAVIALNGGNGCDVEIEFATVPTSLFHSSVFIIVNGRVLDCIVGRSDFCSTFGARRIEKARLWKRPVQKLRSTVPTQELTPMDRDEKDEEMPQPPQSPQPPPAPK